MTKDSRMTRQYLLQAAEQYLAQAETYEAMTQQGVSDFLGIRVDIIYRQLPTAQWEQLRRTCIQSRLRKIIEDLCAEGKTLAELTVENIARQAKMPHVIVKSFLSSDEWQASQTMLPSSRGKTVLQKLTTITAQYHLHAKRYFASTEQYESLSLKQFAEFLGEPESIVSRRLPKYQWEELRGKWIENRLRQATEAAYAEAITQDDFTIKNITKHAGIPLITVRRFLSEDEWRTRRAALPKTREESEAASYLLQAEAYLARTQRYKDVTMKCFAKSLGVPSKHVFKRLSLRQWKMLQNKWIEMHLKEVMDAVYAEARNQADFTVVNIAKRAGMPIGTARDHFPADEWRSRREMLPPQYTASLQQMRQAMERVYAEAKTQEDFTMPKIAALVNIPPGVASHYIREEWQARRATLPTTEAKVLTALQSLVDANIPVSELTRQRVIELAAVNGAGTWPWFRELYLAARRQLALHAHEQPNSTPASMNVREIPGGWIDLDGNSWDLRPAGKHLLQRERLRKDFADIGWTILREELRSPDIAPGTVDRHYQGFLKGITVLGAEVPDIRRATLEAVQCAWMTFDGTKALRQMVRPCLALIFEELMRLAQHDDAIDETEMLRISIWLRDSVKVGHTELGEEFLSEQELNAVILGCLTDIAAGIAYINTNPNLLTVSLHPRSKENAAVVVQWAVALMILLILFTGLRRESILRLKTDDWAEVHPGLYVMAWKHNKKVEENVAMLPALLVQELQMYVEHTAQVRAALATEFVFLGSNNEGHWIVQPYAGLPYRLLEFAKRHHLKREGILLPLSPTALRRTYTTRALYEGRNLAALRAQLGHLHFSSTLRYIKFDRFEHPAEVGTPLDEYGRKALTLWHAPLILDELDPEERVSLLNTGVKQMQDVGRCLHERCVKAIQGSPPPCSLCEHLVTGPEFFDAWKMEHRHRKQELESLAEVPSSEMLLAQKKYQFERFEANFVFVQERFHA